MKKYQGRTAEEWAEIAHGWANAYNELVQETNDNLHAIAAKQQRDNAERETEFRVVTTTGITAYGNAEPRAVTTVVHRDEIPDYTTAQKIAEFYDGAEVQGRSHSPWKTVTAADFAVTGN